MNHTLRSIYALVVLALSLANAGAVLIETSWAGSNPNWFDPDNWNPVGVPDGSTNATLDDNSSVTIDGGLGTATTVGLHVGGVDGTSTLSLINAATLNSGAATIGQNSASVGVVNLDGSGWLSTSSITIGGFGNGSVSIINSGSISATTIYVGTGDGGTGLLDLGDSVSGSSTVSGAIVVGGGGTLTGNGFVFALPTTIESGGHLAADNSRALQFAPDSNLILSSGSHLDFSLGEGNATFLSVIGADFSADSVTVNITELSGFGNSSVYDLLNFFDANANTVTLANFTLGAGVTGYELAINDSVLQLVATAIPEPSTYAALFGAGALGLAILRRRRLGA
jgi:T5SS/PEP-CTERM-associated repeat protein